MYKDRKIVGDEIIACNKRTYADVELFLRATRW